MFGAEHPGRRLVAGEAEQVVALIEGKAKPAREGGDHLLGRLGPTPLLQAGVVISGHRRKAGDLLPPEALDTPPWPFRQTHVFRLQGFAPAAQEIGQFYSIHMSIVGVL